MLFQILKSRKGSALGISLLLIVVMSLMGISLMALSLSSLEMSIFYSDVNSGYFLAEAGVEIVAKNLDKKVGIIQEEARAKAAIELQGLLKENPILLRDSDGSLIIEEYETQRGSKLENMFMEVYNNYFYEGLRDEFINIGTLGYMKTLLGTSYDDGVYPYRNVESESDKIVLKEASFNSTEYTVKIRVRGEYNQYIKEIEATFSLLPRAQKIPYQPVGRARINNPVRHEILKKAIVTEKNMIVSGGNVTINGDVLSFGTVPFINMPNSKRIEDYLASWYSYGGIMVGMCRDVALRSEAFGFDNSKTAIHSSGSLSINGNASTMSYIHTLYSTIINPSKISITGNTYARSVRSQRYANYSQLSFNNLSTIENLQVDSNITVVDINGKYKGFVDTWHAVDGSGVNSTDEQKSRRTSSVIVNGDSVINFKDEIYIGGSTFLKGYIDEDGNPYMTGISALKSTRRIENAYMKDDIANPDNNIYWYENGQYVDPLSKAAFKSYTNNNESFLLMDGKDENPGFFSLINRGLHFKGIWENLWKPDDVFSFYINPFSINITENGITEDGRIRGYSNGAIIANGRVYDIFEFEEIHDPVHFHLNIQKPAIEEYFKNVEGLLGEKFNYGSPRLDFVVPTKSIESYIDYSFVGSNRIVPDKIYIPFDLEKGFIYYGKSDVEIKMVDGNWYINSQVLPVMKGIIYVDGNIYIKDGFEFTGILMSSKNIVFNGNANITYNQSVIDQLLNADVNINGFFSQLTYEMPDDTLKSQRTSTKNISIISFREVK
ncbi:UNVERIFIED_CONTAM: hypothetical protein Cloal_4423 [Acetivibrio alkalicellulosi]